MTPVFSGSVVSHALRIPPGVELGPALLRAAELAMEASNSRSAFIMTCVGTLSVVSLQNAKEQREIKEKVSVVGLLGTISADGEMNIHISVSNVHGEVLGGPLASGVVDTTLELVLGTISGVSFRREFDSRTGDKELVVGMDGASNTYDSY